MQRRDFLKSMGALSAAMALPKTAWASINPSGKTLVLIELNGGNDSLNTFVPHMTEAYYTKRPTLSLGLNEVMTLSENLAMNDALEPLKAAWDEGDMAVVQGLGYENPNRSHFRSIEIWETASDSDQFLQQGWLAGVGYWVVAAAVLIFRPDPNNGKHWLQGALVVHITAGVF